jgi:hypothetical protein
VTRNCVTGHHVNPQPEVIVREQRKRHGGMYATPIYLRDQAVEEKLVVRVVPKEEHIYQTCSYKTQ